MTATFSIFNLTPRATGGVGYARFASKIMEAMGYPGSELPRGYFCSVTPP